MHVYNVVMASSRKPKYYISVKYCFVQDFRIDPRLVLNVDFFACASWVSVTYYRLSLFCMFFCGFFCIVLYCSVLFEFLIF